MLMTEISFAGQTVIVTGAGRGLGRSTPWTFPAGGLPWS